MIDNQVEIDEAVVGIAAAQTGAVEQNCGNTVTVSVFQGGNHLGQCRLVRQGREVSDGSAQLPLCCGFVHAGCATGLCV